ncbi:MAG: helix-turn-helix domain-containing protein [Candidatus Binatia bacterium]|nr:helix-turn-helix domain-containing protein [Candidatus Binatia bacterium]
MAKRSLRRPLELTESVRRELEWLANNGPEAVKRNAQIVLARAKGLPLKVVALRLGVHPNTVRNRLLRFYELGVAGLTHAATGTTRPIVFSDEVRAKIVEIAQTSPRSLRLPHSRWSLRRLRGYLLEQQIVQDVSVEGLRQILRGHDLPQRYWRRGRELRIRLTPAMERLLATWANGPHPGRRLLAQVLLSAAEGKDEEDIATTLGISLDQVESWIRGFQRRGLHILHSAVSRAARFVGRRLNRSSV